jgi:hypothetical protein
MSGRKKHKTKSMKTPKHAKHIITTLLISALGLGSGGCASIIKGSTRKVSIDSQPPGASVVITKADTQAVVQTGTTPFTVNLDSKRGYFKGQSYTVRLELPGYQSDEILLESKLTGWYFGNIVFGGLIGMLIVDPLTGAMWNITPEKIERPLTAQQISMLQNGEGFLVSLIADTTPAERDAMKRVR